LVIVFGAVTVRYAASWVFVSLLGEARPGAPHQGYRIDVRKPITLGGGEGPQMIQALTAIMRRLDIQKATKPRPKDPVCICVPLVGSDGKLVPQPSPDCPIAEHSQLARDLIAAAQGRGRF
jgi:hypothetical protein